jgi:hypothetical protein
MADNKKDINVGLEGDEQEFETPMDRFFFHQRRALEETGKALEALLPPDFRSHAGEASKEFAKGFHVLVDAAIDELKKVSEREEANKKSPMHSEEEDNDDDEPPSTTGKTKVKVKLD